MRPGGPIASGPLPAPPDDGAQTVRRALAVLRLVATGQEHGVRLTDLAAMSGLSRPTVHRLLKALGGEAAAEQDPETRRYRIGPELALLGLARAVPFPIRAIAEPGLLALARQAADTVFLSLRHGADSVCVARHVGHHAIQVLSIDVGARRPLGASVSGIALLAALEPEQARSLTLANAPRLAQRGRSTAAVLRQVQAARQLGYAYAAEGVMPGTSALATTVRDADGEAVAAISIAALAERLDRRRMPLVLAMMQEQGRNIARRLVEVERAQAGRRRAAAHAESARG